MASRWSSTVRVSSRTLAVSFVLVASRSAGASRRCSSANDHVLLPFESSAAAPHGVASRTNPTMHALATGALFVAQHPNRALRPLHVGQHPHTRLCAGP